MAKKRIKNKNRIEAKSENKVLHGVAGSIEALSYTHFAPQLTDS